MITNEKIKAHLINKKLEKYITTDPFQSSWFLINHGDGKGVQIQSWDESILGPQPTERDLPTDEVAAQILLAFELKNPTKIQAFYALKELLKETFNIELASEVDLLGLSESLIPTAEALVKGNLDNKDISGAIMNLIKCLKMTLLFAVLVSRK